MGKSSVRATMVKIDIKSEVSEILVKTGENAVKEIKAKSPVRAKGSKKYKDGWTFEVNENEKNVTVFNNGEHKSLSHLLEFGHKSKSGKNVPPQEHIRPAYNKVKEEYLEDLKSIKIKIE